MPSPLELPSPSPVQESDDASIDDESSLSPEDEDDTENEEEHEMDSSLRPTSFVLNGKRWSFENPVSLVLAAARQLGMAVQRDARLLWIADEALLDEYDEEQVRGRVQVRVPGRWLGVGYGYGCMGTGVGTRAGRSRWLGSYLGVKA